LKCDEHHENEAGAIADNACMCLLAIAWNTHPRWRLLLAGNRDEFHGRAAAPLSRWIRPAGIIAGRDLQSGGTWAGVDTGGRMAVVTNVRDPAIRKPGAPSRGALVVDYLAGGPGARQSAGQVLTAAGRFAPFNLLLADDRDCMFVGNTPAPRMAALQPGVHGLSNGDLDEPWPKVVSLCQRLDAWIQAGHDDPGPLWDALADESPAADAALPDTGVGIELERMLSPAFIRGTNYGTRASTLIAIDHDGRGWIAERSFGPEGGPEGETVLALG
jgi:uncharacterized protein with NRDE domain